MAIRQFLTERTNITIGSSVKLPDDEAEHIRKSLRMQPGDKLILFNGEKKYQAELTLVTKDTVLAEVKSEIATEVTAGPELTLVMSLIRAHNFELVIQKATELGIDNIIPLQTEFSQIKLERTEQKLERWQKISVEAAKQSERSSLLNVFPPVAFTELKSKEILEEFDLVLFLTYPRMAVEKLGEIIPISKLTQELPDKKHIAILVGPEGGFSPTEHQLAIEWGLKFVSINSNVLRAETAAIAACAIVTAQPE